MHLDGWTLLLQAINFGVLLALLRWLFYRPLLRVIEARRQSVAEQLATAAAATHEAEAKSSALRADRAALEASRGQLLETARQEAAAERESLDAAARRDAEAKLASARQQMERERDDARKVLLDEAATLATALATRLLSAAAGSSADAALDAALRERLAGTAREERERWFDAGSTRSVRVVTAHPVAAPEEALWREQLATAFGAATSIAFEVDASLVAGSELRFPQGALALTWRDELEAARGQMLQAAEAAQ